MDGERNVQNSQGLKDIVSLAFKKSDRLQNEIFHVLVGIN